MTSFNFTSHIKPMLLVLIPVLNGFGQILKAALAAENPGKAQGWIRKHLASKDRLPAWLLAIGIAIASIYGLVSSELTGWKYILDALIITGLVQGSACAFMAMGLFDSVKTVKK
ncbi:MAG: hypothetical protein ACTTJZ_00845 [Sphaerochaetaceae bacterium]